MNDPKVEFSAALSDWKLVFRTLHSQLRQELELIDSDLFMALQTQLQSMAKAQGVDVTNHAAWDAWLGGEGGTLAN